MGSSEKLLKYNIKFNRLASQLVEWGDSALRAQYYRGLPDRIKDEIMRMDYIETLEGTRTAAHKVDARHWGREKEKRRDNKSSDKGKSSSSSDKKDKSSNQSSGTSSGSSGNRSNQTNKSQAQNRSSSTTTTTQTTQTSSTSRPPLAYAKSLGPDGKITQAEKDRRRKEGLCMYCGGKGHIAADCKKKAGAASGRSVSTSADSSESKKSEK